MEIRKKLALILIASILLTAIPLSIGGYHYTKAKILEKSSDQIIASSQFAFKEVVKELDSSDSKLQTLADLIQAALEKPIKNSEIQEFNKETELYADGIRRSRKIGFDGTKEAGMFLPVASVDTNFEKVMHLRIKQLIDIYGGSTNKPHEYLWFMSNNRSEVVFDNDMPNFVFNLPSDTDFRETEWMQNTSPTNNPKGTIGFTPPLYDPVNQMWIVSATYPLYINNKWVGSLGHDLQINNLLSSAFSSKAEYQGTENFILDKQNNFIFAGHRQKQLLAKMPGQPFNIDTDPNLKKLLNTPLNNGYSLINQNIVINGVQYMAIGAKIEKTNWRHYKIIPINEILRSTQSLFANIVILTFLVAFLGAGFVVIVVNRTIIKRIRQLVAAMKSYKLGDHRYIAPIIDGADDISVAAKEFDQMHLRIDEQLALAQAATESLKASESALRKRDLQYRTLVANVPGVVYQCDNDNAWTMHFLSDSVLKLTGYPASDFIENKVRCFSSICIVSDEATAKFNEAINAKESWELEYKIVRKDQSICWIVDKGQPILNAAGEVDSLAGLIYDITEAKEHQEQLEKIAHYDTLTNLPNRALLADRLEQAILRCQRFDSFIAIAYLDLDGFKEVNDQHGHSVGDKLLIQIGERMRLCLRETDTFARIGGDEFVALMCDLDETTNYEMMLTRLLDAASESVIIDELPLQVSASIGVARFPQDGNDADQLIRHADQAMYIAKLSGKNRYHLFDVAHDNAIKSQRESLQHISDALNKNQFVLHYQPKVNMKTGSVVGVEALIRWQHPERGLLPPSIFLPVIENHPLSLKVGEWVIKTALSQISAWQKAGINLPVSVNIGALQLQQNDFAAQLAELLKVQPDVHPQKLELEIVETSAIKDIGQISELMHACCDLGVSFALDDFGTGYSSLTYLKRLPANTLKIDQSFVRDMIEDEDDLAIVNGVVGLARAFQRMVVAEGVETIAHGKLLLGLGCELAQGYGIAKPMSADNIPEWVNTWVPDQEWTNYSSSGN